MKISAAQVKPISGDIGNNIDKHSRLINLAHASGANFVFFPELSLTGYEPKLARQLALYPDDTRLDIFQQISDTNKIGIGLGVPARQHTAIVISMFIFQPHQPRLTYAKQLLHADELPYFTNGHQQVFLSMGSQKMAPAICYESLQPEHARNAYNSGAGIYLASVAKSANGVAKAYRHYPELGSNYGMAVLMANCVGFCDDFESVGQSAVWNTKGKLVGKLNETDEGILTYDLNTEEIIRYTE